MSLPSRSHHILSQGPDFDLEYLRLTNKQMLKVTVYNKMGSPSEAPGAVGQHDLIAVYGGDVNWEDELSAELEKQIGTLLITGITSDGI